MHIDRVQRGVWNKIWICHIYPDRENYFSWSFIILITLWVNVQIQIFKISNLYYLKFRYVEIFKASVAEFRRAQGGGGDRMGGGPMRHGRMGGGDRRSAPYGGGGRGRGRGECSHTTYCYKSFEFSFDFQHWVFPEIVSILFKHHFQVKVSYWCEWLNLIIWSSEEKCTVEILGSGGHLRPYCRI